MKFLGRLSLLLILAAAAAGAWAWFSMARPYQGFSETGVFVDLPRGASSRGVARLLQENGVLRSAVAFEIYTRRHPRRRLQAGEYFFDHAMTGREVFWKIANGQVYERPFTVREGETMFGIAHELEAGTFMSASDFLGAARNAELIQDIAPHAPTLEGFLYPATYLLPRHPSAADLTAQMVRKFKEEWQGMATMNTRSGATAEGQGLPVASIVTLASLVERETPKPEERPLVAGAFENRLHKNMPLQCDPTVVYALEQIGKYRGTLSSADLHFDSPYNTYLHAGLPPGPIGNPGEASLRAALAPAQTDFLYFVANTQGGHFFSATLAEHNRNVSRYRRLLAGLPADLPPAPSARKTREKHHRGPAR